MLHFRVHQRVKYILVFSTSFLFAYYRLLLDTHYREAGEEVGEEAEVEAMLVYLVFGWYFHPAFYGTPTAFTITIKKC